MKHCVVSHDDSAIHDAGSPRKTPPRGVFGGIALSVVAFAYACAPYVDFAAIGKAPPADHAIEVTHAIPSRSVRLDRELLDPARPLGFAPRTFAQTAPLRSELQLSARAPSQLAALTPAPDQPLVRTVQSIPLPVPRPVDLGASQAPNLALRAPAQPKIADPFEKLFGKRQMAAFASADGGVPQNDGLTAIYDITARTVYMPDGTRLEAHSGLGDKMDDIRYVNVRMHGATPPHVYDLSPREALFHGDEALRMYPVGGSEAIFGRAGLLTHSYLLGPNGQSNGCVSFKDYLAFLAAYKAGKVRRLAVVASIDDPQFDLRLLGRAPVVVASQKFPSASTRTSFASFSRPVDDRYFASFSASLASRTSSSARSLN